MSVSRSRSDSDAIGGTVGGYAPLDSGLLVPAAYQRATGCIVAGTSTALSSGAYVSLAFDSTDTFDSDAFHDPSSNNTRMTVPRTGVYRLEIQTTWPSSGSANTDRRIAYRVNAGTDVPITRWTYSVTSVSIYGAASISISLASNDYVEARQWTGIGSTTTTLYGAQLFFVGN